MFKREDVVRTKNTGPINLILDK